MLAACFLFIRTAIERCGIWVQFCHSAHHLFVKHGKCLICRTDCRRKTVDILKWSVECSPLESDLLVWYFECFGTSIELQRRTRNINSFRMEWLNRARDCTLPYGEFRRSAGHCPVKHHNNSICRLDAYRKTVDILVLSGECSPLSCHFPVWHSDKSLCRADLYGRRQDTFSFRIEFRRWRINSRWVFSISYSCRFELL